jgi:CheY-like chemotaxis protein
MYKKRQGSILVVEDDPVLRLILTKMIAKFGLEVETAANGSDAVHLAGLRKHSLIIMDVAMPEMDGLTAATQIRKEDHTTPIVALTAQSDADACLESGMNDYIQKPLSPRDLERMLQKWVGLPSQPTIS